MATKPLADDDLFRIAFHASPDSVNINRLSDGLFIDVNQGFTDLTGYTRDEVIGRTSFEISIWADLADRARLVAGLQSQGAVSNLEASFRFKDGSVRVGLMSARVLTIAGEPHILSITRDITERKEIEDRLLQARNALEQSERLYRALFDSAAHGNLLLRDGRIVDVNLQGLRLFGRARDHLVGKAPHELSLLSSATAGPPTSSVSNCCGRAWPTAT